MANTNRIYHPTELVSYQYCPMKWKLQYVDEVAPTFVSWPKVRGIIIHQILELGSMAGFDNVWDAVMDGQDSELPFSVPDEKIEAEKQDIWNICFNTLKRMLDLRIEIVERELNLHFSLIGRDEEYEFSMRVDALAKFPNTPDGMVEVLDYKTGNMQSNESLNRNLQFGLYYIGVKFDRLYVPNNFWWVKTNDFLPYKKAGKTAVKGNMRGQGFYGIRITDDDAYYINREAVKIIELMKRPQYAIQVASAPGAPCGSCEYSRTGHCPSFKIGATDSIEIKQLVQGIQDMKTDELLAKIGGMTDVESTSEDD